jgi:cbb3-type cytochrome oxidase subunit 3
MTALLAIAAIVLFLATAGLTFLLTFFTLVWIAEWWHYRRKEQKAKFRVGIAEIAERQEREWQTQLDWERAHGRRL